MSSGRSHGKGPGQGRRHHRRRGRPRRRDGAADGARGRNSGDHRPGGRPGRGAGEGDRRRVPAPGRHQRGPVGEGGRGDRPGPRPHRHPGQRRRHRGRLRARLSRDHQPRAVAQGAGGEPRRDVPRLQARAAGDEAGGQGLDRQHLLDGVLPRHAGERGLRRLQGRGAATDQVGGGARQPGGDEDPLQLGAPGRDPHAHARGDLSSDRAGRERLGRRGRATVAARRCRSDMWASRTMWRI